MKLHDVASEPFTPLHSQIAAQIRRAIAEGEISSGARLPPVVDFAAELGVNKNTVIKALHILRDEGLLELTRGRGIRVVGTVERGAILSKVDELIALARTLGLRREEITSIIHQRYS
ncbi:MAG TPA: GntR family transcriptional regulator [Acidimicrobiales bacterium]